MSTLNSSSTLTQIEAAYADNASYAEDRSVSKCRGFITACRILVLKIPKGTSSREGSLQLNPELVLSEKKAAEEWLAANESAISGATGQSTGTVTRASFRNCR